MTHNILFALVLFCLNTDTLGNVCLHDKRVRGTDFESPDHNFNVPGDYYDTVITGIFGEMKRTGSEVFSPVNHAGDPAASAEVEGDHEHEAEGGEGEHTLTYLVLIMMFSLTVIIVQARLLPSFPTPISTLFTGVLFAVIYKQTSPFGPKSDHIVNIDSEYIIFGFTPILILGEVLRTDVRMIRRLMLQFVFYGLVGGCLNAIGVTAFMRLALGPAWSFELLMCIGALLSTSDASFTSRLLKKVGVPERLVMLVEGEAINDAPMFTVLLLAKELYSRLNMTHDHEIVPVAGMEVVAIATRLVLSGLGLGVLMAVVIVGLLKFTSSRFEERNSILQILITVIGCYSTFLIAEVVFDMSGSLAVVTVGWILAWRMWPLIVSEEGMTSFWSTIDFAAESLLYLLVGFYVGIEAYSVDLVYGMRVASMLWGISMGCRFVTIFLCWPVLNRLGPPLGWRDLVMWGWCGLKGRVCLALITDFSIHLLEEATSNGTHHLNMKSHVIFVVGVVFFMTSVVNGGLAGVVAMLLRLDKSVEMEDKLKSIFFKYSIFNALKQDHPLADRCHHLARFTLSGGGGSSEGKVEIFPHQPKPSSSGIDWVAIDPEELVVAVRSTFLTILKSLYWGQNGEHKVSIFAMQGLLSSIDRAMEDVDEKPINDFYHLMLMMPSRETKSNHYRIINMLTTMAECHIEAREIFEKELMKPVIESDAADVDMLVSLRTSWETVRGESEKSENYARREMSVRFTSEEIETYSTLRNLHLEKIEEILHTFSSRRLLGEKDIEEAHEALHEDMEDIKAEMRSIGSGRSSYNSDGGAGHVDDDDETRPLKS